MSAGLRVGATVHVQREPYRIVEVGTPGEGRFFGRVSVTIEAADGRRYRLLARGGRVAWNAALREVQA